MNIKYPDQVKKEKIKNEIKSGKIKVDEELRLLIDALNSPNSPVVTTGCCVGGGGAHAPNTYISFAPLKGKVENAEELALEFSDLLKQPIRRDYLYFKAKGSCFSDFVIVLRQRGKEQQIKELIDFVTKKYTGNIIAYLGKDGKEKFRINLDSRQVILPNGNILKAKSVDDEFLSTGRFPTSINFEKIMKKDSLGFLGTLLIEVANFIDKNPNNRGKYSDPLQLTGFAGWSIAYYSKTKKYEFKTEGLTIQIEAHSLNEDKLQKILNIYNSAPDISMSILEVLYQSGYMGGFVYQK